MFFSALDFSGRMGLFLICVFSQELSGTEILSLQKIDFPLLHLVNHVKIRSEGRKRMRHGLALCQDRKGMLCVRLQLHF